MGWVEDPALDVKAVAVAALPDKLPENVPLKVPEIVEVPSPVQVQDTPGALGPEVVEAPYWTNRILVFPFKPLIPKQPPILISPIATSSPTVL